MEFGALFVNQPALRGGRKAQLLAEGGFEGRHDLLLAAHDAVEPEVGAFDEGLAETFGDAGGIVGDHEKFGAFLHDVREEQKGGVTTFLGLDGGELGFERGLHVGDEVKGDEFELTDADLAAVHVEVLEVAEDERARGAAGDGGLGGEELHAKGLDVGDAGDCGEFRGSLAVHVGSRRRLEDHRVGENGAEHGAGDVGRDFKANVVVHALDEFYRIFAREVISCAASTLEKRLEDVKQFLKAVSPSITLKSDPTDTLSFDLKLELEEKSVMEILELPEKIAAAKGIHLIVCIDEFQQLALLPGYKSMEGKMRSAWQKQQQVSYCFYGSKRHMMMDIFNNSSNPFYRFGQVLFLQKIKKEEWVPFIVNAFHRTNKEISEQQAEQLCDIVKCHSWYLQQLCYFIWSGTSEKVTDEIIEIRTRQLIDTNMPMFMNDTENLTAAQTAMLRAVADGEYRFNSIPVVRKYELGSAQTITRNKRMLTERDFIEKEGNKYVFSDPIFELWFRREYC